MYCRIILDTTGFEDCELDKLSKIVGVSTDLFSGKYILLVGDEEFGLNPTCAVRTVLGETEFNSLKNIMMFLSEAILLMKSF